MTDKEKIGWYLQEHTRIVGRVLGEVRSDPRLKAALIIRPVDGPQLSPRDPEPWEEWLRSENTDAFYTLQRLRARANEIWISGSDDSNDQRQFTNSIEMEYKLSVWAARQFLKQNGLKVGGYEGEKVGDDDHVNISRCGRG